MIGPLGVLLAVVSIGAGSAIIGKAQQQQQPSTLEQANEVVSDNNNGGAVPASENQFRANYYYVPAAAVGTAKTVQAAGNRNVLWNRDSYSDAASEYGYNLDSAQAYGVPHQGYQAQYQAGSHNTPAFFSTNNNNDEDGLFDLDSVGTSLSSISGGLGGLGGLLGLKGLKGLGLLGLLKLGWPLLLFLGLPLLFLAPLLLMFLPIPIITIPTNPNGRTFGPFRFADFSTKMTDLARSVLESDKCIERVSCEISRISRGSFIDKAVTRAIQRFELQMPNSLKRMARAYLEPSSCRRYTCSILPSDDSFKAKKST